ncbi:MAG TPA: hypothetical protein H9837_12840 [Candidatus Brachybacterium merdigallinarum]|nr:hypothetical protein [Candidatus Brachybacterium merdigallinarum]
MDPDLDREATTPLLRRCTALAANARIELILGSRHASADELEPVLAQLESWSSIHVVDPDPTMLALAIAALEDLHERVQEAPEAPSTERIARVVALLRELALAPRLSLTA